MKKYKTGAAELKELIQQVLHHPDFDPRDVDHDMHERLMRCIKEEDIQVIVADRSVGRHIICM
jgi:hypothetical protein